MHLIRVAKIYVGWISRCDKSNRSGINGAFLDAVINPNKFTQTASEARRIFASRVSRLELPKRRAATQGEIAIIELLSTQPELALGQAVDIVAEALFREESRAGAWAVDLGLFGSRLFQSEARRILQNGDGELWRVG